MTGSVCTIFFFRPDKKKINLSWLKMKDWRGFIYDEIYSFQRDYAEYPAQKHIFSYRQHLRPKGLKNLSLVCKQTFAF